ncbi:hypothetical protein OPQ81_008115 [Rhizoctonia solani]|nr:hypothetical protein OPQ81_008115 [Rhizoctonia solani]
MALFLIPSDNPVLPSLLYNLGAFHGKRFQRLRNAEDCDKAIEYGSLALALAPEGHPDLSGILSNLGASHGERFQCLNELSDLEKAIENNYLAIKSTPNDHPDLSRQLANLGTSHMHRFQRLGELGDLEKAIGYLSRALALTPDGHPILPGLLANLGVMLKDRFHRLAELGDLEKAIVYEFRALVLTPDGHPDLPDRLSNLAASYSDRFRHLSELGDIEKAVEYQSRALALTPNGHPYLARRLHNLGVSYSRRFDHLGEQDDLEKVIECMTSALDLTPDGDPNLPTTCFPLAVFRFYQYRNSRDPSHLQDSLASFRMASQSLAGSPRDKFRYAVLWTKNASAEPSLRTIEAHRTAIDLLPQFIWLGATSTQRYEDLSTVETLAVDAAAAAIHASDPALALEWLDHARCVVWNQSTTLRSPLDHLHSSYPDLAARLQTAATQLHSASSQSQESRARSSGSLDPEKVAREHRQLAQEYNDLLAQARALPGFKDLLQPMKANDLVRAARSGPIVVINCQKDGCDALVITPRQVKIRHITLPNFTGTKAQLTRQEMGKLVRNSELRERGVERRPVLEDRIEFGSVLESLWYDVVKPVLDALEYTKSPSSDNLPHVTWCPTGALSFLPLHAAGDYTQSKSKVFDYVISSYTPTLTALLSCTPSSLAPNSRVLAISQPNTPGHSPLPGTSQELVYVRDRTSGRVEYSQLMGAQATTTAVLNAMEEHDWVHLACHAHQNIQDPTKSGFFLQDGALDLESINRRSFKNKGLAYLSACQTATGDERLPDEAIHLASGMLMAGYSSVIATMWSVMDDDAPFVADRVYDQLMKEGKLGNGEAGKALHYAIVALRAKVGEKEFRRWVPYIHIGS